MHLTEIIALMIAGAAAGVINSLAGGGTLVTFPVLLLFGIPPIIANATSTVALFLGTTGSIFGYRQHLPVIKPWLSRFLPVSLVGGLIGSILLTRTSNDVFSKLVPFLILFATLVFLAQGALRRFVRLSENPAPATHQKNVVRAVVFQFFVAIYGGYFGAGIGILMLASLGFIGLTNIYEMNALKTTLGSLLNLVAAIWFVWAGLIDWPRALTMTLGAMGGYYIGAHYSQQISQRAVRMIITGIGFTISTVTFYQQFCR